MSHGDKVSMTFRIYDGERLVRTETFAQDIIKIGRLPSNHLRIEDEKVSRLHAVIEITSDEEVYILDLGSESGTIINGTKISKCKLRSGDEIRLGGTRVVIEMTAVAREECIAMASASERIAAASERIAAASERIAAALEKDDGTPRLYTCLVCRGTGGVGGRACDECRGFGVRT